MATESDTGIIEEYDSRCKLYGEFTDKVEWLIRELLSENGMRVLTITSRLKNRESLDGKIRLADGKYTGLDEITDVSGVRIITYFASEVDRIAEIIEKEFVIDSDNSVDKRKALDPDRFGYLSLHYVAQLADNRVKLTEYRRYKGCRVEIQIRSILQHAWAEIEHDLGYKSEKAVPHDIRRGFAQLAGLLEIADGRFDAIRRELQSYETEVQARIATVPSEVAIDKASLGSLVSSSLLVRRLDAKIASFTGQPVSDRLANMDRTISRLEHVGLRTIQDVVTNLENFEEQIAVFAEKWISPRGDERLNQGISLFYLCYVLLGARGSEEDAYRYLEASNIGKLENRRAVARDLMAVYRGEDRITPPNS